MYKTETNIGRLYVITPSAHYDSRGWFIETYNELHFQQIGILTQFKQDNHSMTNKAGVIRGLHFQNEPKAQVKLIRCTRGSILDVAVDLRKGSPTFKKWFSVELSAENMKQLYIPRGFAHGFISLVDNVEVQYKVDEFYSKEFDRSIRFDDPEIGIDWGNKHPILSQKDCDAPLLKDSDANFIFKGENK
jgi:dTDP-4-dehydrorhamnose 3,5-epimerase